MVQNYTSFMDPMGNLFCTLKSPRRFVGASASVEDASLLSLPSLPVGGNLLGSGFVYP